MNRTTTLMMTTMASVAGSIVTAATRTLKAAADKMAVAAAMAKATLIASTSKQTMVAIAAAVVAVAAGIESN